MKILPVVALFYSAIQGATGRRSLVPVRGGAGGSLYELNPDYIPPRAERRTSHQGDLDHGASFQQIDRHSSASPYRLSFSSRQESTFDQFSRACGRLYSISPALYYTTLSCSVVFILWQLPAMRSVLSNYFVLSRYNLAQKRIPCILLSAISHEGLIHLLGNLFVLLHFGPTVKVMLRTNIWPLLVGAAIAGSITFLLLDSNRNGSLGLSSVTLAIVAVYARMLPKKKLTTVVAGLIPVQLEAQRLLLYLLASSVFGVMVQRQSPIAHSSHLGGIIFGVAYYEVWLRHFHWRVRV